MSQQFLHRFDIFAVSFEKCRIGASEGVPANVLGIEDIGRRKNMRPEEGARPVG
jgi:hypothetical protein